MDRTEKKQLKLLVTGGTGFIGSHLLRRLVKEGYDVFSLQRIASNTARIEDISDKITIVPIRESYDFRELFAAHEFNGIIHVATHYVKYSPTPQDIDLMNKVNILFPSALMAYAAKQHAFFLNTGTCFEFEPRTTPISENDAIKPFNYYAATKLAFEELLKYQACQENMPSATLKLFFPYGEQDNEKLFVLLIRNVLKNKTIAISKGEQFLNFTYVSDIIDAYSKTIAYLTENKDVSYEIFNIGSDETITLKEAVNTLEELTGKKGLISLINDYSKDEIMHMQSNNMKAKHLLKWQPEVSLKEGLSRMITYYEAL